MSDLATYYAMKSAKIQHQKPIGQYYPPQKPGFRKEQTAPYGYRMISQTPFCEIADYRGGGHTEGMWKKVLFRIHGKYYAFEAYHYGEVDENGEQVFFMKDGRRGSATVWENLRPITIFYAVGEEGVCKNEQILPYSIADISDPIMNLVMDFLCVDGATRDENDVRRIVINSDQPIAIKNWEVIQNG